MYFIFSQKLFMISKTALNLPQFLKIKNDKEILLFLDLLVLLGSQAKIMTSLFLNEARQHLREMKYA